MVNLGKRIAGFLKARRLYALGGAVLGVSFLVPETWLMFGLGTLAGFLLCLAVERDDGTTCVSGFFLFALVSHPIGFHWLPDTLTLFGGFPYAISGAILLLYTLASSVQFLVCGWLCRQLRASFLSAFALVLPCSWGATEFLFPRIFPWHFSHTQTLATPVAGMAAIVGTTGVTIVVLWLISIVTASVVRGRLQRAYFLGLFVFVSLLSASYYNGRTVETALEKTRPISVGLVQGNLAVFDTEEVRRLDADINTYRELSKQVVADGAELLFWPESVAMWWTPGGVRNVRGTKYDAGPEVRIPLVYGGLGFERRSRAEQAEILAGVREKVSEEFKQQLRYRYYNSAFAVSGGGELIGRYDKRALMPFGEYLPFEKRYPSIRKISPYSGNFDRGRVTKPFALPLGEQEVLHTMPLICYEDLLPSLARESVIEGAQVLLNLTNDAWYGDTVAPRQHHLLALWRALETRRYFVRVTNTGFTGVVDPFGRTIASLPGFVADSLVVKIKPLDLVTPYVRYGDIPLYIFSFLVLILGLVCRYVPAARSRSQKTV